MKVTSKNYDGKLYIKLGRKHIPLEETVEYFENLEKENEQLKQQINKMKCCGNCKHYCINDEDDFDCCRSYNCTKFDKWELAEV